MLYVTAREGPQKTRQNKELSVDDWCTALPDENLQKCARRAARSAIMAGAVLCAAFSTLITTSLLFRSATAATILHAKFKHTVHTVRTTVDGGTALLYFKLSCVDFEIITLWVSSLTNFVHLQLTL